MSDNHLSEDTLVAYVMDHLGAADTERVEEHVAGCEQCAAALEREAKLEVLCSELQSSPGGDRQSLRSSVIPAASA